MGKTRKHIQEAKFKRGLLHKIPIEKQLEWNRQNCDIGYYRNIRNKKRYRILDKL